MSNSILLSPIPTGNYLPCLFTSDKQPQPITKRPTWIGMEFQDLGSYPPKLTCHLPSLAHPPPFIKQRLQQHTLVLRPSREAWNYWPGFADLITDIVQIKRIQYKLVTSAC